MANTPRKPNATAHRPRLRGGVLVVEANGYGVTAGVVSLQNAKPSLQHVATSTLAPPHEAAKEAIAQLKGQGQGQGVPRDVLLLTAQAVAGVVQLPVSPGQPRPAAQMQELVRWELESVLAQSMAGRPLGAILVGRGHLTHREATEVGRYMGQSRPVQSTPSGNAINSAGLRFGDTAVEMDYATRAQVDECLRIQQWFQAGGDQYVCGCRPLSDEPVEQGVWRWMAAAISREARSDWRETFDSIGLRLAGVYPVAGAAAPWNGADTQGAKAASDEAVAVVEVDPDQLTCTHLGAAGVTRFQHRQVTTRSDAAARIAELCAADVCDRVLIAGHVNEPDELTQDTAAALGTPVAMMRAEVTDAEASNAAGHGCARLLGAARSAIARDASAFALPAIAPTDPPPPRLRQPRAWWAAAAVLVLLSLVGAEALLRTHLASAEQLATQRRDELRQIDDHIDETRAHNRRVTAMRETLAEQERTAGQLDQQLHFFTHQLDRRAAWLSTLLNTLGDVTPPGVVIDRVQHERDGQLRLDGWAMSQRVPEAFAERLNERLARWGVAVRAQSVERGPGRLNLEGYAFEMRLGPVGSGDTHAGSNALTELPGGSR